MSLYLPSLQELVCEVEVEVEHYNIEELTNDELEEVDVVVVQCWTEILQKRNENKPNIVCFPVN